MKLSTIRDKETGKFPTFAWPGGYPIIYFCHDSSVVCADCVNDPDNAGWAFDKTSHDRVIGADIFYEGAPEQCANCNVEIESAYGDPDALDEEQA